MRHFPSFLRIALLSVLAFPAFAANYANSIAVALASGQTIAWVSNSGPLSGGAYKFEFTAIPYTRIGLFVTPIDVPPDASTVFTDCPATCGLGGTSSLTAVYREGGQQYFWIVDLDSGAAVKLPLRRSAVQNAYVANKCDGLGTLPMIEPAITTTSPLPMPQEVTGQDCSSKAARIPLRSGHASTGIRWWMRVWNVMYKTLRPGRVDGKARIQINGGAWQWLSNSNTNLVPADPERHFVVDDTGASIKVGGGIKLRAYLLGIPDGTINPGDTTVDQKLGNGGTEGIGGHWRCLECFPVEGTDYTATAADCTSNLCTIVTNTNTLVTGDSVLVRGASGMWVLNGPQGPITRINSTTFTFTPHAQGSGGSKPAVYIAEDGNYMPPVNRNPVADPSTDQDYLYVTRMLVDSTAFTYPDGTEPAAPSGGNVTDGMNLFKTGNIAGTTGLHNQLKNAHLPELDYQLYESVCESCHTQGSVAGIDLAIHKYSNASIVARSMFHGLTYDQGVSIAKYIRSLATGKPYAAQPWNPPFQSGPGMADGTFTKAATTLTSIVVSSNVGTFTVPGGHGYRTGNKVITSGATVDTDLNKTCTITVTSSTVFTCPTSAVSNATYTESTLQITNPSEFPGGCGVDCKVDNGYGDMYRSISDASKWVHTSNLEPRVTRWPYYFPDLIDWWPEIYPGDVYQSADYMHSQPKVDFDTILAAATADSYTSYAANWALGPDRGPGQFSLVYEAQQYMGIDGIGTPNPGSTLFRQANVTAGAVYPSLWPLFRQGVTKTSLMNVYTLQVGYGFMGMYGQMMAARNGAPSATGCNPPWGFPGNNIFIKGAHVEKNYPGTILDGTIAAYNYLVNAWYIMTLPLSSNSCYDTSTAFIDSSYLFQFLEFLGRLRVNGWANMMDAVFTPQAGRNNANLDFVSGISNGLDWAGSLRRNLYGINYSTGRTYWLYTDAEWTTRANLHLSMAVALANSTLTANWRIATAAMQSGIGVGNGDNCSGTGNATVAAYLAWLPGGTVDPCNFLDNNLTMWTLIGADAGNIATMKAWGAAVWPSHDWNIPIAAATQGDTGDYGSFPSMTSPGSKTVTFSSSCPIAADKHDMVMNLVLGRDGVSELIRSSAVTGGTCPAAGGTGTLVITTTLGYANNTGLRLTYGCSKDNYYPNDELGTGGTRGWRCLNMREP